MSRLTIIKVVLLLICFLFGTFFEKGGLYAAKKKTNKVYRIKEWCYRSYSIHADTQRVDTSYLNLPMRNILDDYSMSYSFNGNVVSPVLSRVYFDRQHKIDDIFGEQYQPYILTPTDVHFFNTTIPYSKTGYQRGFTQYHAEYDIDFFFTANLSKRYSLGLAMKNLTGAGHYSTQEGKLFRGQVMSCYDGRHYFIHSAFTWNKLSNFENGGIQNDSDLTTQLEPEDIAFRIKGMSGYRYLSAFVNQGYSMTVTRSHRDTFEIIDKYGNKDKKDTLIEEYIPIMTFAHTFELSRSAHRYVEQSPYQGFFDKVYRNARRTRDSSNVLTIKNTVSVTFEEEFNKLFRFGLMAYIRNESQRYAYNSGRIEVDNRIFESKDIEDFLIEPMLLFDTTMQRRWFNNTFVGGNIYKRSGKNWHYDVLGDVCIGGYKAGQFNIDANFDFNFHIGKNVLYIDTRAYMRLLQPSFFYECYESNHFRWRNKFSKTLAYYVGGAIYYPMKWLKPKISVGFENNNNYIYFDQTSNPVQKDGSAYVFSIDAQIDFTTPYINLENHVCFQHSSREIPLPDIILYHNLYYHGTWFKALDVQTGVDMHYFTRYYAPLLCPATGQFGIQRLQKIGNYPFVNVYANFHVRSLHLKFYVQYTHINHLFMKSSTAYMAMPNYPMNPDIFRLGILWHFYK